MHVMHVPIRGHHTEFVKPYPLVLFKSLADNLPVNLGTRRIQYFFEGGCIAPLYCLASPLLIDSPLKISVQMTTADFRAECRRGQYGKPQNLQQFSHGSPFAPERLTIT